jgi:hypothetical protein
LRIARKSEPNQLLRKMLYLPTGEPHRLKGIENASLLLTILLPKH